VARRRAVGGDADVSSHVETNVRGPWWTPTSVTPGPDADLTGLAGYPAFLVGGAVLGRGSTAGWTSTSGGPTGTGCAAAALGIVRAGLRRLRRASATSAGHLRRRTALPPARLLERLVPAYSDALPVLAGGGLRPQW
jgi:hypothetical protein